MCIDALLIRVDSITVHEYCVHQQVALANDTELTATTSAVRQTFLQGYHMFGFQEALFENVALRTDMVLVIRCMLRDIIMRR